jgi:Methylamine utilisation protein MauE/AhpC/TSA family
VVSISQFVLTCVFALAGVAKLFDAVGAREAVKAFGVPPLLVPATAVALPVAELAVAVALIAPETARWGALAGLTLLAILSVAIVRALFAGAAPDCNCFGGLTQTPVGRGTLIRNAVLGAVAGLATFGAGDRRVGAVDWIVHTAPRDRAAVIVLASAVAVLGWFCWQLLRQNGRLLLRMDAQGGPLEVGTMAPTFAGYDLEGEPVSLASLLAPGLPVALFFTDPDCSACAPALEAVALAQREREDELTVAVISRGNVERMRERSIDLGLGRVVHQSGDALFEGYRLPGVPSALLIGSDSRIMRRAALGADAARELIEGAPGGRSAWSVAAERPRSLATGDA